MKSIHHPLKAVVSRDDLGAFKDHTQSDIPYNSMCISLNDNSRRVPSAAIPFKGLEGAREFMENREIESGMC